MTTVYLIRHSVKYQRTEFSSYNAKDDKDIKDEKTILSVIGEKRAELLSTKSIFDDVDVIYSSSMVRSIGTAKYLASRLNKKINVDERLNERRYGKKNSDDYPDWYERQYLYSDFKTEGGESQEDVRNRFLESLYEILDKHKDENIAIFSHGYAITFSLLKWCELVSVTRDRRLTFKYKNKIILDKIINAPEVFKIVFDNKELKSIELIEFDDLDYMDAGI